jgi:hypothetical protein
LKPSASAALYGEITLKDGRVEQSNFDTYRALRIDEAPTIEVYIVRSAEPPGGISEAGTSTIVPATLTGSWVIDIVKRLETAIRRLTRSNPCR